MINNRYHHSAVVATGSGTSPGSGGSGGGVGGGVGEGEMNSSTDQLHYPHLQNNGSGSAGSSVVSSGSVSSGQLFHAHDIGHFTTPSATYIPGLV